MSGKSHRTAVTIAPPEPAWEPIQAIRRRYDRQIHRWPPHINLLYPFRPRAEFSTAAPTLVDVCASIGPFALPLGVFRSFRHSSRRCTLWLAPEPAEELRRLQTTLQAAFPDCNDLGRFPAGFTPHLSVGQFPSPRECELTREQLQASWQPITFAVTQLALLAREEDSPFVADEWIPLAASGRVASED
jgi:2'-5' RNA ligase